VETTGGKEVNCRRIRDIQRTTVLGLTALFHSLASHAASEPAAFTLSSALEWAGENAPVLQQVKARKTRAELELTNSKTAFLPSLDLNANQRVGSPNGTSSWALRATETLWSNGTNYITLKAAAANRDALEAETHEVREKLAADVASRWFDYSRTEAVVQIQTDQARLIESQFAVMKRQFEQGLKTREDYQRIRAQLLRTRAELVNLRTQREQIRVDLLALIGIPESSTSQLQPAVPPAQPNPSWRSLVQRSNITLETNPTLARLKALREQATLNPLQARFNYWPNLQVTAQAFHLQNGPFSQLLNAAPTVGTSPSLQWNAGVELSWNLWDWGALRRSIHAADATQNATLAQLKQTELNVKSQARQTTLELKRLAEEALLQAEVASMEEDNFRLVEDNYRRGRSSYLDLITALRDRADARARWNASYFATLVAHVKILQLEGGAYGWLLNFEKSQ
jgi:multidrug efflux system outer membrane protein